MVYAYTQSEYQRVICWLLILKYFGTNIKHISGVENIVSDTLSRLPSTIIDRYGPSTSKAIS